MGNLKYDGSGGIFTYSGEFIHPLDPDPTKIHVGDIAHSLANQCRFTGHVRKFYSTAQHSVHVSEIVPEEWALWGLLHDATETYLSDIASPVKWGAGEFGEIYREVEDRLMYAVMERFKLVNDQGTKPPEIKRADDLMLWAEIRDLMPMSPKEGVEAWDETVNPWSPQEAETKFLNRYWEVTWEVNPLFAGAASK